MLEDELSDDALSYLGLPYPAILELLLSYESRVSIIVWPIFESIIEYVLLFDNIVSFFGYHVNISCKAGGGKPLPYGMGTGFLPIIRKNWGTAYLA